MRAKMFKRAIFAAGYELARVRGSHQHYRHPSTGDQPCAVTWMATFRRTLCGRFTESQQHA